MSSVSGARRPSSAAASGSTQRRRLQDALAASGNDNRRDSKGKVAGRSSLRPSSSAPAFGITASLEIRPVKQKRPATAGTFIRSVSAVTHARNEKSEDTEARLAWCMDSRTKELEQRPNAMATDSPAAMQLKGSLFDEEVKAFEGTLVQMGRRIRMEVGFEDAKTQRKMEEDAKQAAEIRKKDEAARKLRVAAKEAQNPKRRVALRTEQQRLAGEADISTKVPMRKNCVPGGYGNLNIPMVDVRMLQQKSLGLNVGGQNFNAIYSLACDAERTKAWEKYALGPEDTRQDFLKKNKQPGGDSLMSRTRKVMHEKLSQRMQVFEDRERQAKGRRRQLLDDKSFQALCSMRTLNMDMTQETLMSPTNSKALKDMVAAASAGVSESLNGTAEVQILPNRRMSRRMSSGIGEKNTKSSVSEPVARASSASSSGAGTPRCFMWGVIRGMLGMLWLLNRVRERHWAADGLRQFLQQVERFGLLKAKAHHLVKNVIKVQGLCRSFLSRKRQWTSLKTAFWIQIEDQQLQWYAIKGFDGKTVEAAKRNLAKDPFASQTELTAMSVQELKWKALRIPVSHRKFALGRWYVRQLRRKVQALMLWQETMQVGLSQAQDIRQFFELCGLEGPSDEIDVKRHDKRHEDAEMVEQNFLVLNEQDVLDLICTSAQELRDVPPFHRHYACTGKSTMLSKGGTARRASMSGSKQSMRIQSKQNSSQGTGQAEAGKCEVDPNDLEELFRRFTPRLRDIREAPAAIVDGIDFVADGPPDSLPNA